MPFWASHVRTFKEERNMSVRRVFVEKKPEFAVKARELREEIEKRSEERRVGKEC